MSRRGKGPRTRTAPNALRFVIEAGRIVRSILRSVGVPADDVEDVEQIIVIAAWLAVKRGALAADRAAVAMWVRKVARRIGAKAAIQRKRIVILERDIAEREDDAEAPHLARNLLADLRRSTTPERWRVLVMHAEGMTHEEIAAVEHAPPATVHTRLRLARRDIQAAIVRERAREQGPAVPRERRPKRKPRAKPMTRAGEAPRARTTRARARKADR